MDEPGEVFAAHEPLITLTTTARTPPSPTAAGTPPIKSDATPTPQASEPPEMDVKAAATPTAVVAAAMPAAVGLPRSVHIPYILNGELFSIQTQEGENVTVKCCHCPPDRVYRGSVRSTGNFHMHIKRRHPDLLAKLHEMKVCALLERRDRFMKNRKTTHRRSTNSRRSAGNHSKRVPKVEPQQAISPSRLLHTHKLKIKAAFQRHQLQQQQQQQEQQQQQLLQLLDHREEDEQQQHAAKCNWDEVGSLVLAPSARSHNANTGSEHQFGTSGSQEQPLNYSLKQFCERVGLNVHYDQTPNECGRTGGQNVNKTPNLSTQQMDLTSNPYRTEDETAFWCNPDSSSSNNNQGTRPFSELPSLEPHGQMQLQQHLQPLQHVPLFGNGSQQTLYECATTTSTTPNMLTPCPSSVSSYGSQHGGSYHPLNVIKEHALCCLPELQPVDLTKHATGLSGSSGIASATTSQGTVEGAHLFGNCHAELSAMPNLKRDDLLVHVVNSLQDIRGELRTCNELRNKRFCLEMAKFKYLNPTFNFRN